MSRNQIQQIILKICKLYNHEHTEIITQDIARELYC